jgi:hypothetical protein
MKNKMKKIITFCGATLLLASLSLTSCGDSKKKNDNTDESQKTEQKTELSKNDVIGEWYAAGNGIKTKYIFSGDGTYLYVADILGDISSDEGTWEISVGSATLRLNTNGYSSTANFVQDFSSFSSNNMTYTK